VRIGLYVSASADTPLAAVLERFRSAERLGFATAWVGQVFEHDALTLLALASQHTGRIELGTWVLPIQARHPVALAQAALTLQAASGGRLLLGVGVSHEEVIGKRLGLDASAPARHAREYLEVLRPLLAGEGALHRGPRYRVALRLAAAAPPPPVFLAALGPRLLELAAERADGVAIWLGGPRYLEEFALPRLRAAAARAGRPLPRVVCGLPVALVADAARARASAEAILARSARLPAYRRVLERGRAASPAAVALVGSEAELERGLGEIEALGVSDFHAFCFPVEGDPEAAARTRAFLAARTGE
jgi:5,10-methylenetetrahydromethanopterin reductase